MVSRVKAKSLNPESPSPSEASCSRAKALEHPKSLGGLKPKP